MSRLASRSPRAPCRASSAPPRRRRRSATRGPICTKRGGAGGGVESGGVGVAWGLTGGELVRAGKYLNARLMGRTLGEARGDILRELDENKAELDALTQKVVEAGLAVSSGEAVEGGYLI